MNTAVKPAKTPNPSEDWQPLARRPSPPHRLTLLRLVGRVWTFQDPDRDRLYQLSIDQDEQEHWSWKVLHAEREWLPQADAARLVGITRQAIRIAIVHGRLATIDCNGRSLVRKSEVLALETTRRQYKHPAKNPSVKKQHSCIKTTV
jgi:hypothetical protein